MNKINNLKQMNLKNINKINALEQELKDKNGQNLQLKQIIQSG